MEMVAVAVALLVGLTVFLEIGYFLGARRVKTTPNAYEGFSAIEAAVFGIFGLLLSLSFVGAGSRLDARRHLILEEANAIAAAYMRVDLLPDAEQPEVRRLFREYLDTRLRIARMPDEALAHTQLQDAARLQKAIWAHAIRANKEGAPSAALLLIAINNMIDIARSQTIAVQTHLPMLVFAMLIAAAMISSLVAGFGMARGGRNWLSILVYASMVTFTLFVMLDMEFPQSGLIRIGAAERAMSDLRDSIQQARDIPGAAR
jgi:hypothetical protein